MNINVNQGQVWCEIHQGYVQYWDARYVKEDNIREQRPARNNVQAPDEYSACIDCLAEEIHPF
jgi:hypothetical protein